MISLLKSKFHFIAICPYLLFSILYISVPGINSDEILFGNAAIGSPNSNSHIFIEFHGFPIMLMSYIGALKSYIYFPIFKFFGVNILSIRLPMILLTTVSLYHCQRIFELITEEKYFSFFCTLFLSTFCSLVLLTRTDQGPVAIEFFIKVLIIKYLFEYFKSGGVLKHLYFLPLLFLLGSFNKLNFIWTTNAIVGGLVFFFSGFLNILKTSKQQKYKTIFLVSLIIFLPIGYFVIVNKLTPELGGVFFNDFTLESIENRLMVMYLGLIDQFVGLNMLNVQYASFSYRKIIPFFPSNFLYSSSQYLFLFFLTSNLIFLFVSFFRKSIKKLHKKAFYFNLMAAFLIFLQQFLVPNASAGWHFFAIFPFLIFAFFIGLFFTNDSKRITTVLVFILIVIQFNSLSIAYSTFKNEVPRNVWSSKIEDLLTFLKTEKRPLVQLTWGIDDQISTYLKRDTSMSKLAYEIPDDFYEFDKMNRRNLFPNKIKTKDFIFNNYVKGKYKSHIYVWSWEANSYFFFATCFQESIVENNLKLKPIFEINDRGQKVYTVFEVTDKN